MLELQPSIATRLPSLPTVELFGPPNWRVLLFMTLTLCMVSPWRAHAACTTVTIQIQQELTLERQAFDARLQIFNETDQPIEDLLVTVTYVDEQGKDASELFFTSLSSVDGMGGQPTGSGAVPAHGEADVHWLIVPSPGAGGETPAGVRYLVGATLSFVHNGEPRSQVMNPDDIVVKPMPRLSLDYFLQRWAIADDPYTSETEPPVPFALALRIANNGFGPADNLRIESGQPQVVANESGLLIGYTIIGSQVDGAPGTTDLLVEFGDLPPEKASVARWSMVTTLSGEFVDFNASFTHSDALGGELTSLIKEVRAHYFLHAVRVDLPGRDAREDYLGTGSTADGALVVYESDNVEADVADASMSAGVAGAPSPSTPSVRLTCDPGADLFFASVSDPGAGRFKLLSGVRADGRVIPRENLWIAAHYNLDTRQTEYFLSVFDHGGLCDFTITYQVSGTADTTPPVSSVRLSGPQTATQPRCVSSQTDFILAAEDSQSAVTGVLMAIDADPSDTTAFSTAISPFRFESRPSYGQGAHTLFYSATDAAGNRETPSPVAVVLDDLAPSYAQGPAASPAVFAAGGSAFGEAADHTTLTLELLDGCGPLELTLEASPGATFNAEAVFARQVDTAVAGQQTQLRWYGLGTSGEALSPGAWTLRLSARDALGHTSTGAPVTVTLLDPTDAELVAPELEGQQTHPSARGELLVWQDSRSGDEDIYLWTAEGGEECLTCDQPAGTDQVDPAVGEGWVGWLDTRSGSPQGRLLHLGSREMLSLPGEGAHAGLSLAGERAAWVLDPQGEAALLWMDLGTLVVEEVATGVHDPALSDAYLYWLEASEGGDALLALELATGDVMTLEPPDHTRRRVVAAGEWLLWEEDRGGALDVFSLVLASGERRRLTWHPADQSAVATDGALFAYLHDGNQLARGRIASGISQPLTADAVERASPAMGQGFMAWTERRGERWQLLVSFQDFPDLTLPVAPGLNVLALPEEVVALAPTAHALAAAWAEPLGLTRLGQLGEGGALQAVSWQDGQAQGSDFVLTAGHAVLVWAPAAARLPIARVARAQALALAPGVTAVGVASIPFGMSARDLGESLGADHVLSLRRLDGPSGLFEALGRADGSWLGEGFVSAPGHGFVVDLASTPAPWRP